MVDPAWTQFTDVLLRNMDKGSVNDVVFNDLRKTFDTVDHVIMLRKLKTIGVTSTDLARGPVLSSVYNVRKQLLDRFCLLVGVSRCSSGIYSRSFMSSIAIPMIYLTSFVTVLSSYSCTDDTALHCSSELAYRLQTMLKEDMLSVPQWMALRA